jgi:hypothetical protein
MFTTRTATFDFGARSCVPGSTEVQYCTSQPALLRLPVHFRQIGHISRRTGLKHNALHNPYQQALVVRCVGLFLLRPHDPAVFISRPHPPGCFVRQRCTGGCERHLLQSLSHRALLIKVARFITTITGHRLSIAWHQHSVASHSNMRRNVLGLSNHCELNAIDHRLTI